MLSCKSGVSSRLQADHAVPVYERAHSLGVMVSAPAPSPGSFSASTTALCDAPCEDNWFVCCWHCMFASACAGCCDIPAKCCCNQFNPQFNPQFNQECNAQHVGPNGDVISITYHMMGGKQPFIRFATGDKLL
jgi:hypothetical protein